MILYFLRHGLAGDRAEWEGDDRLRPLTKKGEKNTALSAEMMDAIIQDLDEMITSPLVRARQTAEIVADEFGMQEAMVEDERLAPGFNLEKLAEIVKDYPNAEALMLVGHEPDFSETISKLIGGGNILCKKGGLARVDLINSDPLEGQLVWLLQPKVLTL
ncbi:MAG: phosphohistidine phosphatase SixA [Omnitrophica WOR_2 bacterium]